MWLLNVSPSSRKNKKLVAIFCLCDKKNECKGSNHKKVHFGQDGSTTYTEGATEAQKEAYIARHGKAGEDWSDPTTPGALSRWILWSQRKIATSLKEFKKKFSL